MAPEPERRARRDVEIRFGGRAIACVAGDSVAAALIDAGDNVFRKTRAGEPRGVFCGMGVCHECVVTIDGVPGQRACVTPVRDGMTVELDAALPTLDGVAPPRLRERELAPDVLVIGAGPAGLAAAAAAAEAGAAVVLVDERPKPGGQYFKQPSEGLRIDVAELDAQYVQGRELIARVRRSGVGTLPGAQVWAAFTPDEILAADAGTAYILRPRRLILATGAYERGVPLPGWTLPGFLTTGAVQTLLRSYGVVPGRRVLVSGNGPLNVQVAAELVEAGATVVALAELARLRSPRSMPALARMAASAPRLVGTGLGYARTLRRAGVPSLFGFAVSRADGDGRVERATVAEIDGAGRPVAGTERELEVDAVCAGFGFVPSNEIARTLGCRHVFDAAHGHLTAVTGAAGRSSIASVWVVGDGGGVSGARVAQATGFLAGLEAAADLGRTIPPALLRESASVRRARSRSERFQRALSRLYLAPRLLDQLAEADTLVCRCESVALGAIEEAYASGIHESGAVKRVSRAGMGSCQGRYCGAFLSELGARRRGGVPDEWSGFAPAAPFKPLPLGSIVPGDER
jgi:NADPH-dependent 2,4-dienoyl-CoA reductase/sulfur reductase-like enzyme